jgi:hypothetical protein
MRAGRISQGCNLNVDTLDAAIATGQKILADHIEPDDCDGLEIWLDSALLNLSGRPSGCAVPPGRVVSASSAILDGNNHLLACTASHGPVHAISHC